MQNSFSKPSISYANWFESLEEVHEYIQSCTAGMEVINPETIFMDQSGQVKFVESMAFIDLTALIKHEFIINVNNGIYAVEETKKSVILFHEYCRWGHFEEFKNELKKPWKSSDYLKGFLCAVYGDQVQIVRYFMEHNLFPITWLYQSPLYECVKKNSVNSFRYLSKHFEPGEQLLPYILENDALEILKIILDTPDLKMKMMKISQKDYFRIQRDMTKSRFENPTMKLFKESLFSALIVHN